MKTMVDILRNAKSYAGIGSRTPPIEIASFCRFFGWWASSHNIMLRSGGADGCDMEFEKGCDVECGQKEIFLPFKNFNGNTSKLIGTRQARHMAKLFHPLGEKLPAAGAAYFMMGRNMHQVAGPNLDDPVDFVLCWTFDQTEDETTIKTGGTGQAIRFARYLGVPVWNIANPLRLNDLEDAMKEIEQNQQFNLST